VVGERRGECGADFSLLDLPSIVTTVSIFLLTDLTLITKRIGIGIRINSLEPDHPRYIA
jgi:hypothetical protein